MLCYKAVQLITFKKSSMPENKRKRTEISVETKLAMIKYRAENKATLQATADHFGFSKTAVQNAVEKEEQIRCLAEKNINMKVTRIIKPTELNELVWNWFNSMRSRGVNVGDSMLQAKAKSISENRNDFEFKASNGWLDTESLRGPSAEKLGQLTMVQSTPGNHNCRISATHMIQMTCLTWTKPATFFVQCQRGGLLQSGMLAKAGSWPRIGSRLFLHALCLEKS